MSSWNEVSLASVCGGRGEYGLVASATDEESGVKFLRTTDMIDGSINWDTVPYCHPSASEVERFSLRPGDAVISRTGANAGAAAFVAAPPAGAVWAGYLVRFRPDPEVIHPRFLGYVLQSPGWRRYVLETRTGSAQPQLNARLMGDFRFARPPLDVQRRIAGVLGNLDDLIDTNLQVMQSLQRLSDALYLDAWDGESMVEVADLGDLTMGQSPPGDTYNEDGEGLIFYQGVKDFGEDYPTPRVYCSAPSRVAMAGSILIAVRAPVGKTNVAVEVVAIGRGLAALSARLPSLARRALRVNTNTFSTYQDSGTVFSAITKKDLLKVRVPAVEDSSLEESLGAIDRLHLAMWQENIELKTARDELLPLLMSGRVLPGEAA